MSINTNDYANQLLAENERLKRERDEAIAAHRKHAASLIAGRGLLRERAEAAEAELARRDAAAGEAIGEVHLGEYDSDGIRPASVVCLHDQADWENFPNGAKLYTRAEPTLSRDHFEEAISLISRGCADISHHHLDSGKYADDQTQIFWQNYVYSMEAIKCQK